MDENAGSSPVTGSRITWREMKRLVLPTARKIKFQSFKHLWRNLDEDVKEVLAGSLFVLNHKPVGRPEAVKDVMDGFDTYRKELLQQLARYTESA